MIECKNEKIEVVGRDSEAPGLIKVRIPLNRRPEEAWRDCFLNSPLKWTSVHKPDIEGSEIILWTPEDRAKKDVKYVLERIEQANGCYEEFMEKRKTEEEKKAKREAQEREKLEKITEELRDI